VSKFSLSFLLFSLYVLEGINGRPFNGRVLANGSPLFGLVLDSGSPFSGRPLDSGGPLTGLVEWVKSTIENRLPLYGLLEA
jgi:hypothetical protein